MNAPADKTALIVAVPDIGDFEGVEVIEVLVSAGEQVEAEQALITLESDKAVMDVPAPQAGTIAEVMVSLGDRVSEGAPIVKLNTVTDGDSATTDPSQPEQAEVHAEAPGPASAPAPESTVDASDADYHAEVAVIGAGPGGYTAAFRAADLGKRTVLVERYPTLGGVCLNVGCIPSKALLHTADVISSTRAMAAHGITFGEPEIDLAKLAAWKDGVVGQLTKGLAGLARQRKVEVIQGTAQFADPNHLRIQTDQGPRILKFEQAIVAAGSQATEVPIFPHDDPRVMDSTDALALDEIPNRLLVIGGGIIGLEMACVYQALGAKITVVELLEDLLPGCDADVVRPLQRRIQKLYENIYLGTKVTAIKPMDQGLEVRFEGAKAPATDTFDRVLIAVGRRPNGRTLAAENAGLMVDDAGFIPVDRQQRTNVANIFAIGDICGQPMLAHKATHEGKVAAEVAAGLKSSFDALTIPSVAYTDPEVAWTGLTEAQAKAQGIEYEKAVFPWAASGRALGIGRPEGLTKVLFDANNKRLIGAAMVGPHAGDLVAEATLALEMGADPADIGLTIHPHPTLSETFNFAAEMIEGTITDLYAPKKKARS